MVRPHDTFYSEEKRRDSGVPKKYGNIFIDTIETDLNIKLSDGQQFAIAELARMCEIAESSHNGSRPNDKDLFLVIGGSMGIGKTTLSCSAVNYYNSFKRGYYFALATYITLQGLDNEIKSCFGNNNMTEGEIIYDYSHRPLLVIDELSTDITEYQKKNLGQIILNRDAELLPTVLVGNINQEQLKKMLPLNIYDRVQQGKMIFPKGTSYRGTNK